MNVLEWAMSSVLGSPTTQQAGAIDVIAIRQSDGTLTCSPFHVKLGKASQKGERRIVKLKVNGKEVALSMKLGPAGEAFFVERSKEYQSMVRNARKMSSSTAAGSSAVADAEEASVLSSKTEITSVGGNGHHGGGGSPEVEAANEATSTAVQKGESGASSSLILPENELVSRIRRRTLSESDLLNINSSNGRGRVFESVAKVETGKEDKDEGDPSSTTNSNRLGNYYSAAATTTTTTTGGYYTSRYRGGDVVMAGAEGVEGELSQTGTGRRIVHAHGPCIYSYSCIARGRRRRSS